MNMNKIHIKAHQLAWQKTEIEDELKFLEERIQRLPQKTANLSNNLGVGLDNATSILGLRIALNCSNNEIIEALQNITQWGVALFQRAMVSKNEMIELSLNGQKVSVPGHCSYYNSAPRWQLTFGAAMALRDHNAMKNLCAYDVSYWGGSYDSYHIAYVDAIIAFVNKSGDWNQLLLEAETKATNATLNPLLAQQLGLPCIALTQAIMNNDEKAFNTTLATALSNYHKIYIKKPEDRDPVAVIPLLLLGWCAYAHEHALMCNVISDYIPDWIVTGDFQLN